MVVGHGFPDTLLLSLYRMISNLFRFNQKPSLLLYSDDGQTLPTESSFVIHLYSLWPIWNSTELIEPLYTVKV